jgi:uncharacterized protein (TIGR02594 family)
MTEPHWLREAREYIGQRELPGAPTAPFIGRWLADLGAWWRDDATPWCGLAVATWMKACGVGLPKHWYRARAWLDWGVPLAAPAVGAVVVFERQGGGHVGLIVGKDERGRLLVLGGNQGDAVSIAPFDMQRVLGYRWPADQLALLPASGLPVLASADASSSNEA